MTTEPLRLMIPGPVGVEDDVLAALAQPALPNYGYEWLELYNETIERLQQVFGTQSDILTMIGPGSAGLDAALGSLARTGDRVLVAHNGYFGGRLATTGRSYGLEGTLALIPRAEDAPETGLGQSEGISSIGPAPIRAGSRPLPRGL